MKLWFTVTALTLALSAAGCSNKKSDPAPAPAPKAVAQQPAAAPSNAATPITASALWDLAQKDDSQMRKRFTVSGSVATEGELRVDLFVTDSDEKRLVKLFFPSEKALGNAVTGSGTSAKATATCTLVGVTPSSVRLEDCMAGT